MVPATLTRSLFIGTVTFVEVGFPVSEVEVLVEAAADEEAVSGAAPELAAFRAWTIFGKIRNLVVAKASNGMVTTAMINGSHGFNPPADGDGTLASVVSPPSGLPASLAPLASSGGASVVVAMGQGSLALHVHQRLQYFVAGGDDF